MDWLRLVQLPPPAAGAGPHNQSRWSRSQTAWIKLQIGIKRCHPQLPPPRTALGKATNLQWKPSGGANSSLAFQSTPDPIKSLAVVPLLVCSHWKYLPEDVSVCFSLSLGHTSGQSTRNCKVSFFFPPHFPPIPCQTSRRPSPSSAPALMQTFFHLAESGLQKYK